MDLRALRRDRAARTGGDRFLLERAFEDCLERLSLIGRRFEAALLIGCPDPTWKVRLAQLAERVSVLDPGPTFARAVGGSVVREDAWNAPESAYDLVVTVGTLDTVDDLPGALRRIRHAMSGDALLLGAFSGGETLPQLRAALRAADAIAGEAAPHVHPRIEASALAPLLTQAGFTNSVVDVDRVQVAYPELQKLVVDLRSMAATNLLRARPPRLSRRQYAVASRTFFEGGDGNQTLEVFEILHFAAWTPV